MQARPYRDGESVTTSNLDGDSPRKLSGPRPLSSPAQTVALAETAEQLISLGWTPAKVLPNGKVVLQRGIRDSSEAARWDP